MTFSSLRNAWRDRQVSNGQFVGLSIVFVWFFAGGIMHFAATDIEASIVPPYIAWPVAAVLVSGVFELLGAAGILVPRARKAAGIGLFLLTLAVRPAHIYMLQRPELFHVPVWALWLRLPIQAALLWLIRWSTWRPRLSTIAGRVKATDKWEHALALSFLFQWRSMQDTPPRVRATKACSGVCLNSHFPMDLLRQRNLFGYALEKLEVQDDLINHAIEVFEDESGKVTVAVYEIPV